MKLKIHHTPKIIFRCFAGVVLLLAALSSTSCFCIMLFRDDTGPEDYQGVARQVEPEIYAIMSAFDEIRLPEPQKQSLNSYSVDSYTIEGHSLYKFPHDLLSENGKYCAFIGKDAANPPGIYSVYFLDLDDWKIAHASIGNSPIQDIAFTKDSKYAAICESTGRLPYVKLGEDLSPRYLYIRLELRRITFTKEKDALIIGGDNIPIYKIDFNTGSPTIQYSEPLWTQAIDTGPNYFAVGLQDQSVRLWAYQNQQSIVLPSTERGSVKDIAFVKGKNQLLASYARNGVLLWDLDIVKTEPVFGQEFNHDSPEQKRQVTHIDVSADGTKALFSLDSGEIVYFDLENQKEIASIELPGGVHSCASEFMKDEDKVLVLAEPDNKGDILKTLLYVWHLP